MDEKEDLTIFDIFHTMDLSQAALLDCLLLEPDSTRKSFLIKSIQRVAQMRLDVPHDQL